MTTGEPEPHEADGHPVAGRYVLGPVIGIGSSAVVRRGHDLRDDAPVAVKIFHSGDTPHDHRQQRLEMAALGRLSHPGLVGLHGGGISDGRPFVVTDLHEGPSLAERIKHGPVPPAEVRRIGAELAAALAQVHDGGIVHRDVKPANVLLGDGTAVRLVDFGIARTLDGAACTAEGGVVGTAAYLAPEQARGEQVGPPTDVYALGLVLLEALTARREYPGQAVESATERLHRRPAVPAALPGELTAVLRGMTEDDPAHRPSAAEVAARLYAAPDGHRARRGGARRPVAPDVDGRGPRHAADPDPGRPARPTGPPRHAQVPEPRAGSPAPVPRPRPPHAGPPSGPPTAPTAVPPDPAPGDPAPSDPAPDDPASRPHTHPAGRTGARALVRPPRRLCGALLDEPERVAAAGGCPDPATRGPRHRRRVPSRAIAPLAAAVLVLAAAGGAALLFGPGGTESEAVGSSMSDAPAPPVQEDAQRDPVGVARP